MYMLWKGIGKYYGGNAGINANDPRLDVRRPSQLSAMRTTLHTSNITQVIRLTIFIAGARVVPVNLPEQVILSA
jgi:hypothetical protein